MFENHCYNSIPLFKIGRLRCREFMQLHTGYRASWSCSQIDFYALLHILLCSSYCCPFKQKGCLMSLLLGMQKVFLGDPLSDVFILKRRKKIGVYRDCVTGKGDRKPGHLTPIEFSCNDVTWFIYHIESALKESCTLTIPKSLLLIRL